jgi:hypothetical protein
MDELFTKDDVHLGYQNIETQKLIWLNPLTVGRW